MNKYEIVTNDFTSPDSDQTQRVYRIRALIGFKDVNGQDVHAGDLGGYVAGYDNLSQSGRAWVAPAACVWGQALVTDDALVSGWAQISDRAIVSGQAWIDYEEVRGDRRVDEKSSPPFPIAKRPPKPPKQGTGPRP